ncbi:NAD(P)-binding domain-containing protein, partial [Saccharothrix sp. MB29]|nr:NAD(P)-binding domain-containing protein [Saccharothrix sp. MB29]
MQLGLVGLGKMGFNMRERIRRAGHEVVGYDRNPDVTDAESLADMVGRLSAPRVVWVMVPAGDITRQTIADLGDLLDEGDLVIDGGNSRFTDDTENAEALRAKGVHYMDAGV